MSEWRPRARQARHSNLKYVQRHVSRHGKVRWYFRVGRGPRFPIYGEYGSPEFMASYNAIAVNPQGATQQQIMRLEKARIQHVRRVAVSLVRAARNRSKRNGFEFDLTVDWVLEKLDEQDHRCSLTGIKFFSKYEGKAHHDPFRPSLDRIIAGEGYTKDNVRIVLRAVNVMLFDWGEDVFRRIVWAYRCTYLRGRQNDSETSKPTLWANGGQEAENDNEINDKISA